MSRFEEVVNEAIDAVVLGEASLRAEGLAAHIAERVRERQGGLRAEVRIAARYPGDGAGPGLGHRDPGDLHPVRHRRRLRARHPHADRRRGPGHDRLPLRPGTGRRGRPRAARRARLRRRADRARSLEVVPVATHNQRGIGTPLCRLPRGRRASTSTRRDLLRIVEQSMSSEIYELMKRPDELAVVEKAHAQPRFVEDCVREMVRQVVEELHRAPRGRLRDGPPGEPRDDPPPQRGRRALRHCSARSAPSSPRGEHSPPPHDDARVARGPGLSLARDSRGSPRPSRCSSSIRRKPKK